jgi:hypothetical protein
MAQEDGGGGVTSLCCWSSQKEDESREVTTGLSQLTNENPCGLGGGENGK